MRRLLFFTLFGLLSATVPMALAAPEHDHGHAGAKPVYQCPMHPWIKSDQPRAKCTVCGMDLVAAIRTSAGGGNGSTVTLSPSVVTTIGVQTSTVSRQSLTRTVRVTGRIEDDDTRHRILSARIPGRVEHLHLTYVGASIEEGAPLATLYSPEMLTAQRVFIERLRAGSIAFAATDIAAARERLLELGLNEPEIAELERTQKPSATVVLRSPATGVVVDKFVYEGQYVQTSDRLFEIADFSRMWFLFDAYEQDVPWLRVGQTVQITTRAVPGEVIEAPIAFIDPNFSDTTRTTKVRVVLPNPHFNPAGESHVLLHRVLAEARVLVESPAVLAAPRSAILDAGNGPLAYVDVGDGNYEQRKLRLGRRGDTLVEILDGLTEGEAVVTTAALLIDAQAQLTHAATSGGGHQHGAPAAAPAPQVDVPMETLAALVDVASEASDALASDDFAAYQKIFPRLQSASESLSLPPLELGSSLKAARRSFEPWSTAVADLAKPHRAHLSVKVFQCPMTPVLGQGRWVQRNQPLKNPFFGSAMLECGEEIP